MPRITCAMLPGGSVAGGGPAAAGFAGALAAVTTAATRIAIPVIGDLRSVRLDDYHRLDVRASRRFARKRSVFELFIDVQNLYSRRNDAGFEVEGINFTIDDQGQAVYKPSPETWLPLLPSFGVSWTF